MYGRIRPAAGGIAEVNERSGDMPLASSQPISMLAGWEINCNKKGIYHVQHL